MGLRNEAAADLAEIFADSDTGMGWSMSVVDPAGTIQTVKGRSTDIGHTIDSETGEIISGRTASVSFSIASLLAAGFTSLPVGIADASGKPWRVDFDDINGNTHRFKVQQTFPDRALGVVVCVLESYVP